MSPQIQTIADTYTEARERLHALLDGMDDETFNRKPSEKGWSVGECVVHLNTISKGYLPVMEAVLTPDAPRADGPFRWGWLSRRFIEAVRPGSRSMPTLPAMKPPETDGFSSTIDRERAVARFDADTDRWLALCERADGLDLARIRVAEPFLPLLRLPLGANLEAMGLHAVRHVQQAERAAARASA